jgi:hypothetical protein
MQSKDPVRFSFIEKYEGEAKSNYGKTIASMTKALAATISQIVNDRATNTAAQ